MQIEDIEKWPLTIEAIDWAIEHAPIVHMAPLVDARYILIEVFKEHGAVINDQKQSAINSNKERAALNKAVDLWYIDPRRPTCQIISCKHYAVHSPHRCNYFKTAEQVKNCPIEFTTEDRHGTLIRAPYKSPEDYQKP